MILAIDPGNIDSGYVLIDEMSNMLPVDHGKIPNQNLLAKIYQYTALPPDHFAIEMVASYGMAVGREVFDTLFWIGRFWEAALTTGINHLQHVYRREEKLEICKSPKAKDANIRRALIDQFAGHDLKNGKGTKKNPDFFYGFHADVWQAFAVGITYYKLYLLQPATTEEGIVCKN